jgi:t-SNARE complex subunit (syntaxin)
MVIMVREQGQALGKLEEHIESVLSNVKEAENEIEEAASIAKSNTKRTCRIFLIVMFLVLSVIAILLLLLFNNN